MKQIIKDYVIKIGVDSSDVDAKIKPTMAKIAKENKKVQDKEYYNLKRSFSENQKQAVWQDKEYKKRRKEVLQKRKDLQEARTAEKKRYEDRLRQMAKEADAQIKADGKVETSRAKARRAAERDAQKQRNAEARGLASSRRPFNAVTGQSNRASARLQAGYMSTASRKHLSSQLNGLNSSLAAAKASGDSSSIAILSEQYRRLTSSIAAAERQQAAFQKASQKSSYITTRFNSSLLQFAGGFSSIYAAIGLATSAYARLKDIQGAKSALTLGFGSKGAGENEYKYVLQTANKYGLDANAIAKPYGQFAVAGKENNLSSDTIRKLFENISIGTSAAALSQDDTAGVFRGFQQALSKQKLSAEEYRQQIGERLPQAAGALQRATGLSMPQLLKKMESGKLFTKDIIVKWTEEIAKAAKETGALEQAMSGVQAQQNRLNNKFTEQVDILSRNEDVTKAVNNIFMLLNSSMEKASAILNPFIIGLSKLFNFLVDLEAQAQAQLDKMGALGEAIRAVLTPLSFLIENFDKLAWYAAKINSLIQFTSIYGALIPDSATKGADMTYEAYAKQANASKASSSTTNNKSVTINNNVTTNDPKWFAGKLSDQMNMEMAK